MNVKIISVDTTSYYFHRLTAGLDEEVSKWIQDNPNKTIISVTPSFHNVVNGEDNVAFMVATIIYN